MAIPLSHFLRWFEAMEEDTIARRNLTKPKQSSTGNRRLSYGEDEDDEECDAEAWQTLSKSFKEVQSVLDQNRALIQQVNENHQSKIPDNMVKNVALIKEINGNISRVMGIYSDLSLNFTKIVQQRRAMMNNNRSSCDGKVESSDS
ncbi:hypothetical protein M9H77_05950 [Catharanthus roseus]|uniref:Uncharacterized protein n=1 Tax=Catharanthus roseus TaxID=4058 RepID=A0ACC0BQT8_CATRO|nr:hypothetical protein M9H77_05950 [Catharanthus roseus]